MEVKLYYKYLMLHCHNQNDLCIKMGNGANYFIVSLIVTAKSQDSVDQPQFLKRQERCNGLEPSLSAYQPIAPFR